MNHCLLSRGFSFWRNWGLLWFEAFYDFFTLDKLIISLDFCFILEPPSLSLTLNYVVNSRRNQTVIYSFVYFQTEKECERDKVLFLFLLPSKDSFSRSDYNLLKIYLRSFILCIFMFHTSIVVFVNKKVFHSFLEKSRFKRELEADGL